MRLKKRLFYINSECSYLNKKRIGRYSPKTAATKRQQATMESVTTTKKT